MSLYGIVPLTIVTITCRNLFLFVYISARCIVLHPVVHASIEL